MSSLFERNLMSESTLQYEILKYFTIEQIFNLTPKQWELIIHSLRMVQPDFTADDLMDVFKNYNDAYQTMSEEQKNLLRQRIQTELDKY